MRRFLYIAIRVYRTLFANPDYPSRATSNQKRYKKIQGFSRKLFRAHAFHTHDIHELSCAYKYMHERNSIRMFVPGIKFAFTFEGKVRIIAYKFETLINFHLRKTRYIYRASHFVINYLRILCIRPIREQLVLSCTCCVSTRRWIHVLLYVLSAAITKSK